jgi:hypothetical protein
LPARYEDGNIFMKQTHQLKYYGFPELKPAEILIMIDIGQWMIWTAFEGMVLHVYNQGHKMYIEKAKE